MTVISFMVSSLTALVCGLVVGRCLRDFRAGAAMATSIATAAGLMMLQTSEPGDLLNVLQPKVALHWLPLVCSLAAGCVVVPSGMIRAAAGCMLSILTPLRLLWGSVYLPAEHIAASVWAGGCIWSVSIAAALLLQETPSRRRMCWNTTSWVAAVSCTVFLVATSGSLLYGAAAGVCAMGMAGVLISTSQITNIAAVPLICLIGLSSSFAELPLLMTAMLFLVWGSVLTADRIVRPGFAATLRVGIVIVLLAAISMTAVRLTGSGRSTDIPNTEYGALTIDKSSHSFGDSPDLQGEPEKQTESPQDAGAAVDPFDGLTTE